MSPSDPGYLYNYHGGIILYYTILSQNVCLCGGWVCCVVVYVRACVHACVCVCVCVCVGGGGGGGIGVGMSVCE